MDRSGAYIRVAVYIAIAYVVLNLAGGLLLWIGGYFAGVMIATSLSAIMTNLICLRIYGGRRLADLGLRVNPISARNFGLGLAGGMGSAALVLLPPLVVRAATLAPGSEVASGWATVLFTMLILLIGSAGEEILFHGFGFQALLCAWEPYATIFTVGAVFAALHGSNPNSTWLAIGNTAGFGILFGYAFLRSGDLWLPIGLHFGWNFTLPLFGVNVSGLTMRLTGYEMQWNVSPLWSGGEYGPEGGVLTTIVLVALAIYLWKAPVQNQRSEVFPCVPGSLYSS